MIIMFAFFFNVMWMIRIKIKEKEILTQSAVMGESLQTESILKTFKS